MERKKQNLYKNYFQRMNIIFSVFVLFITITFIVHSNVCIVLYRSCRFCPIYKLHLYKAYTVLEIYNAWCTIKWVCVCVLLFCRERTILRKKNCRLFKPLKCFLCNWNARLPHVFTFFAIVCYVVNKQKYHYLQFIWTTFWKT